jgi:hypothetical protein
MRPLLRVTDSDASPGAVDPVPDHEPSHEPNPEPNHEGHPTKARRRRRVTTTPPVGSDPTPVPEPERTSGSENEDRLKADKPPHWG